MAIEDPADENALVGRLAVDWLFSRTDGGSFFDGALSGVLKAFGAHVGVGAVAPLGLSAEPSEFFFVVEGTIDHNKDWEHLVDAHLALYDQTSDLWRRRPKARGRRHDPFERFHLVMQPQPPGSVPAEEAVDAWLRSR